MSRPRYSIVLPTLHGGRTLSITLPAMLRVDRDDVEFVVSENHSDDGSYELLRDIAADDDRVKLIRPTERLPLGKHLDFAYTHATGRWLTHIGDDDYLPPWRFDLLDEVIEHAGESCSLVRGDYMRYSWPEYPEPDQANSLDPVSFHGRLEIRSGREFAAELLNQVSLHGGGAWAVRSDVVHEVRRRCGFFASPQHVEFFAMRAAACLSERTAILGLPLFVLGRHSKSSGTQYFLPKKLNREQTWDWSFEDADGYRFCPFNWKSYSTLSLDGAMTVQKMLSEELGGVRIDWRAWTKSIHTELLRLIRHDQLPSQALADFYAALSHVPAGSPLYWRWRTGRLQLQSFTERFRSASPKPHPTADAPPPVSLPQRTRGNDAGFHSIVDVASWLEKTHGAAVKRPLAA